MFRWSSSILIPEPANDDVIRLEESEYKCWQCTSASWASFHYIVKISCLLLLCVWMRKKQPWLFIVVCQSTEIIFLCIAQLQKLKKQFHCKGGLNLQPKWDLNYVIDWNTNNLSHHGWAKIPTLFVQFSNTKYCFMQYNP